MAPFSKHPCTFLIVFYLNKLNCEICHMYSTLIDIVVCLLLRLSIIFFNFDKIVRCYRKKFVMSYLMESLGQILIIGSNTLEICNLLF